MGTKNRLTAYFLILVFLGPIFAAHLLYRFRAHFQINTLEQGILIEPVPIQSLTFHNPSYLGKWQLLIVVPEFCDTACQLFSKTVHQIHVALGKEQSRIIKRTIAKKACSSHFANSNLIIVDPKGWLIMHYPHDTDPKGILADLRRLLRFSHVG